jgi:hypothetical protein
MTNTEIEKKLPIFKAKTVESDNYEEGIEVEGDFVYTPAWVNTHGLAFAASYEIWLREEDRHNDMYSIDPQTLEISMDGGKTFTRILKENYV